MSIVVGKPSPKIRKFSDFHNSQNILVVGNGPLYKSLLGVFSKVIVGQLVSAVNIDNMPAERRDPVEYWNKVLWRAVDRISEDDSPIVICATDDVPNRLGSQWSWSVHHLGRYVPKLANIDIPAMVATICVVNNWQMVLISDECVFDEFAPWNKGGPLDLPLLQKTRHPYGQMKSGGERLVAQINPGVCIVRIQPLMWPGHSAWDYGVSGFASATVVALALYRVLAAGRMSRSWVYHLGNQPSMTTSTSYRGSRFDGKTGLMHISDGMLLPDVSAQIRISEKWKTNTKNVAKVWL